MDKLRLVMSGVMLTVALGGLPACGESDDVRDDQATDNVAEKHERAAGKHDAGATKPSAAKDIVSIAVADGRFKTLAKALTDAKLVETLQGKGPFTVFAPTDAAFEALGQATLGALTTSRTTWSRPTCRPPRSRPVRPRPPAGCRRSCRSRAPPSRSTTPP
jgi:hypothetical protein